MSVNFHSSSNHSLLVPNNVSANSIFHVDTNCYLVKPSSLVFIPFTIVNIVFILPLCIFILSHGFKRWRQAAAMKHSDCFTYHAAFLQLIGVLGCLLCFCGICGNYTQILVIGTAFIYFSCFGESFFHILTCLERYLAVVHPVTYLKLRNDRGVRIRNLIIVCTWLLCVVGFGLMTVNLIITNFLVMMPTITIISFCSLSVLRALIRPGPGKQSREKVDQSKMRAFYILVAILGVLLLRFVWGLVWAVCFITRPENDCLIVAINIWFNLPSSLVLPLLFLLRVFSQKNNTESKK